MPKTLVAAALAVAILGTGCIVIRPHAARQSGTSAKECPPGHLWSDGRCHPAGKGHDPAKRNR
jgi:hypothetical protein